MVRVCVVGLRRGPIHVLIDSTGLRVYGAGQWREEKHDVKSRQRWRKLHLALDADRGDIIAHVKTDQQAGDASQVGPLLDQIEMPIGQCTADGAYDGNPTYEVIAKHSADAAIVTPPRSNALEPPDSHPPSQRDRHIAAINADGRMKWQFATSYGKRSLFETAIGPLQIDHWPPLAGALILRAADGGRHRLRHPQSNAGMRTPELRPGQNRDRIATAS